MDDHGDGGARAPMRRPQGLYTTSFLPARYGLGHGPSKRGGTRQPATGRSRDPAGEVAGGGEVVNTRSLGLHKPMQMGRFPGEGYGHVAYFRNMQVFDWDNSLIPAVGLLLVADHPSCYDVDGGQGGDWGNSAAEKH
ncbi:hypothetical protein GUJ93_ZPchr0016g2519 [Zizania palustris]|uniref:Neprosin PEP catalytic domain-containing protein n=1 Tax=Zizania palustris TaxID=103762 RepID=A0A8J5TM35_ZIZPA|nr:hypothetical protein GUJ93_ZPchr0016g2519 [Zizania palustris]